MVASLIAPRSPGTYAPWGEPARLGNLDIRDLTPLMDAANSGARAVVTVVGDISVPEAVRHAAARLGTLPAGALPSAVELGQPSLQTSAPTTSSAATTFLCVWHTQGGAADPNAASVTAAALQTLLSRVPGLEVTWRDGDAHAHDAWAALTLRVAPEALATLGATLAGVGARVDAALLADAVQRARDQASRTDTAQASKVEVLADTLASRRAAEGEPGVDLQSAVDVAGRLVRAIPVFIAID
jgi:predicted Zn-dependent peptidase